ncbi:MAG: carbon storage regulator [Planctomycetales bacterium]
MLVLSRKKDELIQIGDNIVIKVIAVEKGSIKLGIDAPLEISVLRGELCDTSIPGHPLAKYLRDKRRRCRTGFPHPPREVPAPHLALASSATS